MVENTSDSELSNASDIVDELSEVGLLTERQARAYVEREILDIGRYAVADEMGIAATTLDDYHQAAKKKVKAAAFTMGTLDRAEEMFGDR